VIEHFDVFTTQGGEIEAFCWLCMVGDSKLLLDIDAVILEYSSVQNF